MPTEIETAMLERTTEQPQRTALEACQLFDELSTELFYGFNFKMELMELSAAEFNVLKGIVHKARDARRGTA